MEMDGRKALATDGGVLGAMNCAPTARLTSPRSARPSPSTERGC